MTLSLFSKVLFLNCNQHEQSSVAVAATASRPSRHDPTILQAFLFTLQPYPLKKSKFLPWLCRSRLRHSPDMVQGRKMEDSRMVELGQLPHGLRRPPRRRQRTKRPYQQAFQRSLLAQQRPKVPERVLRRRRLVGASLDRRLRRDPRRQIPRLRSDHLRRHGPRLERYLPRRRHVVEQETRQEGPALHRRHLQRAVHQRGGLTREPRQDRRRVLHGQSRARLALA